MLKPQKHLFQLEKGTHYLNCAYKSPLLKSAEEAAINALIRERNPIDVLPKDFFTEVKTMRKLFGEIVNCKGSEVAVIPSTSYGFSSALNNIQPKKGQHAISIENEFPSGYFSIERWCNTHDVELNVIGSNPDLTLKGEDWNKRILAAISKDTAVVILSSIHWMNGIKFDLEKIGAKCKSVDAKFIVDGTQSVGVVEIDVKKCNIDALFCASYKWLFGPHSLAVAYFSETFNNGIPLEESWMNRTNAENFSRLTNYDSEYTEDAGRFNVGQNSNLLLMPMFNAALTQILEWTIPEIEAYCKELIKPLISYLEEIGVEFEPEEYFSSHLFNLNLPAKIKPNQLREKLVENNVYISVRGDALRVSVNVFNTKQDIEKLIIVIKSVHR